MWPEPTAEARSAGFGPSRFTPGRRSQVGRLALGDFADVRKALRKRCPAVPGVYGFFDPAGRLVYVGKSKSLRQRLATYFYSQSDDQKSGRIAAQAVELWWEPLPHELLALLRELELIRRWMPGANVRGKPGRVQHGFLYRTLDEAPCFRVAKEPPRGCRFVRGPLPIGRRVQAAVEQLNHYFGLRDCPRGTPMHFADQPHLFKLNLKPGCLRFELARCLGPCVGGCTRGSYHSQLRKASDFLAGRSRQPLVELEREMREAAELQQFERAARLRNACENLTWLRDRLLRIRDVQQHYRFVYAIADQSTESPARSLWCVIDRGIVQSVLPRPCTPGERERAARRIMRMFAAGRGTRERDDPDHLGLIAGWFLENEEEIDHTFAPEAVGEQPLAAEAIAAVGPE